MVIGMNERIAETQRALTAQRLAALVCRLPEHLVMLSGYWPVIGRSAIVIPAEGDPVLLAPAMERDALARALVTDIRTFPVWKLADPPPDQSLARLLKDVAGQLRLGAKRIGFEGTIDEELGPTQKVTEPWTPSAPARTILEELDGELVDASGVLRDLRARKTAFDLERIRTANEIAAFGIRAFERAVEEGRTEAEVAAEVERVILARGTGYKATVHATGEALIFSGRERLDEVGWGIAPPTARRMQRGDLVMLELSTVADGYYSDLTRMATVGDASPRQRELLDAVAEAQRLAIAAVRPGAIGDDVDRAARDALRARGLAQHFIHITGHGLGFRYHEPVPLLYPGSESVLAEGMVTSVEPGLYGKEFGGVRIEDNVVVTSDGSKLLSRDTA